MSVQVVSGFVPIVGHPRTSEEYSELGRQLFTELSTMKTLDFPVMAFHVDLERCWAAQWLSSKGKDYTVTHSVGDNPTKNSLAYHIVQHEKTVFLKEAADMNPQADVFVWLDFGILHVPGITTAAIAAFLDRVRREKTISIPGCWDRGPVDDKYPCWRFCGGLMVIPREYVYEFDLLFRAEALRRFAETRNLFWEVNTLARLEMSSSLPIWWYKADHNETMFANYQRAAVNA